MLGCLSRCVTAVPRAPGGSIVAQGRLLVLGLRFRPAARAAPRRLKLLWEYDLRHDSGAPYPDNAAEVKGRPGADDLCFHLYLSQHPSGRSAWARSNTVSGIPPWATTGVMRNVRGEVYGVQSGYRRRSDSFWQTRHP